MPAYMVVTARIHDRDAFIAGYGAATAPLVAQFGGKYLLRAPGALLLEGSFGEGASMAISEWPDRESALRFWNSAEYETAKKLRVGLADCQVLLVESR